MSGLFCIEVLGVNPWAGIWCLSTWTSLRGVGRRDMFVVVGFDGEGLDGMM